MNRPGDWNCRSCSHLNFQRRDSCQRCGDAKRGGGGDYGGFGGGGNFRAGSPFGGGGGGFSSGPDVRPGDWYCSIGNCGAHNFASRSSCFKCGAFKEDLSSAAAAAAGDFFGGGGRIGGFGFGTGGVCGGSSRTGWKSGDWICTRSGCNEHNFASRMECFRCSAPRDANSTTPYRTD